MTEYTETLVYVLLHDAERMRKHKRCAMCASIPIVLQRKGLFHLHCAECGKDLTPTDVIGLGVADQVHQGIIRAERELQRDETKPIDVDKTLKELGF